MKRIILPLFFAVCCLFGCSNRQPVTPVEQRLLYTPEVAAQYQVDSEWWKIYKDEQLNKLIATALKRNLDYARSAVAINRALYQANLLGADLFPKFSGKGEASTNKNMNSKESSVRTFGGELAVRYEVDLWRKLADTATAGEWEYKATVEDRAAARLALVNNIIDAYFNIAYLDAAILVTKGNISNYERIQQLLRIKYTNGKVDALEPEQSYQSVLAAKNKLIDLEIQHKTTMQSLRILLNLNPDTPLEVAFPDLLAMSTHTMELDVPMAVLANRPDLKAAEYRFQKAFKDVQAARKAWYPSITLNTALRFSSDSARTMFDVPFTFGSVSMNFPFLDWNTVKWNLKISETDYDKEKINFEEIITRALNEVDSAFFQYKKFEKTSVNTKNKLDADIKIANYYKVRYDVGKSELSDWLNALNTTSESQILLLQNRYQTIKYQNIVYKALTGRFKLEKIVKVSNANH